MLKTPIHLGSNWDVREEILRQEGDDAIQYAKNIAEDKEINYEGGITEGNPTPSILGFAEQNKVDMIIMGTLGKSGLEIFLLRSVADKVVRHSKVSVLVVKKQKKN